ncbi:phospholipase D-like domain-containing protein [Lichenicoccus sp.]|uniref:phospholipase D-like domain-containing protein n=1 Tax=Lichenicoccus sp. TaxID=2781899 RepID=UPI003D0F39FB
MSRLAARFLLTLTMLGLLAGCVSAPRPGADADLLAAARADPARALALMREQGERLAHKPFIPGNNAQLLVNGPAAFAALSRAIDGARRRIDMESYEYDRQAGARFSDLLLAARARGVEVNLIYDAWGALGTPASMFDRLKQAGVRVLEFNPLTPNDRVGIHLNRRDHRKLLCVDGGIAITGGVNISQVYENRPQLAGTPVAQAAWRDTDVAITGPVVGQFEHYFMETWHAQHGAPLPPPPQSSTTPQSMPRGDMLVQAIDGAPVSHHPLIYRTLLSVIGLSRHSVHLTTGFFAPTPELARALAAAARRGVDVQIVVPSQSTSDEALEAGRSHYETLLKAGVKIHERLHRVLHAKTAVVDGAWSAIGSSNLDWRSVVWNNEIDAVIIDRGFGARMETLFAFDVSQSRTIDLRHWRERPLLERFLEWQAGLVQSLL